MKRLLLWLVLSLVATTGMPVLAVPVLTVERIGPPLIGAGESAVFELRLSGLTDDILGGFSIDIGFDPAVLAFHPAASLNLQFDDYLGIPDTETVGIAEVSAPGVLHVDQVSLLEVSSLFLLQTDPNGQILPSLRLATLSFDGLARGTSLVEPIIGSAVFVDSIGLPINVPLATGAVVSVPAPGTLALLAAAALALAASRRVRRPAGQAATTSSVGASS